MVKLSGVEADLLAYLEKKEFEFILGYLRTNAMDDTTLHQLRALWTGYCIHNSVDVDTSKYDSKLQEIEREASEMYGCPWNEAKDAVQAEKLLDEFDNFMCEDLV